MLRMLFVRQTSGLMAWPASPNLPAGSHCMQIDVCGLINAAYHAGVAQKVAATLLFLIAIPGWERIRDGALAGLSWPGGAWEGDSDR